MRLLRIAFVLTFVLLVFWDSASDTAAKNPAYKIKPADIHRLGPDMQVVFAGIQYLLSGHQTRQFLKLPNDDRRHEWLDKFWKQRDPTPTTPKNEMLVEHRIRVNLAQQFYKSKKWPGWDKRGEVFIRYGPPDYRGKIWGEVTVNRGVTPPGELWYFRKHDMLVSFQNFGLRGEFIYSIDPLGAAEGLSPEMVEFLLYDTSESLTKRIPQNLLVHFAGPIQRDPPQFVDIVREQAYYQNKPRELLEDIDALINPDMPEMMPRDMSILFQKETVRKVANNFEITLEEHPSSYPFNFDRKELPFYFAVDQFKGGEDVNRVEVQLELPLTIEAEAGAAFEETYHAEVVIWDSEFNEVSRRERDIVLRKGPQIESWSNLIPTQMVMSLKEGYYRMGISVEGVHHGRSSSYRTSFSCEPFGVVLGLSDIVFARHIAQAGEPSIFTKGPLEVIPHPARAYSRKFPLPIYFEVYNLTLGSTGVSAYTIEYKIIQHEKKKKRFWERFEKAKPVISSRFDGSGFSEDEPLHVTVNTENLAKGSFDFLITLTDNLSGIVAYRRGTFSLVD